jgi:hypothetical protein
MVDVIQAKVADTGVELVYPKSDLRSLTLGCLCDREF